MSSPNNSVYKKKTRIVKRKVYARIWLLQGWPLKLAACIKCLNDHNSYKTKELKTKIRWIEKKSRNFTFTPPIHWVSKCILKLMQYCCLDIGGNNKDLDKTITRKIVLESFSYLLNEFKYILNKKHVITKSIFPTNIHLKVHWWGSWDLGIKSAEKASARGLEVFFLAITPLWIVV